MKKLFIAIVTAALLGLGLVATTGAPASAACGYTACVDTTTIVSAKSPVKVGQKGKITVAVVAAGNAKPTGSVRVVVRGPNGYKLTRTYAYNGSAGPIKFKTGKLSQRGSYDVAATFTGTANGTFDESKGKDSFTVR